MFIPMGIAIVFYSPKPIFTLPAMMVAYTACWPYLALTCLRVIAKLEIGNSQYETMKSNLEIHKSDLEVNLYAVKKKM
ncbi:hypothetical protein CIK92_08310 [Prevotella sp. P4-67]|jgi:hypothetical protein|uniref:hypothetical protein n=1 Tax=Prevotella sp. P4-67 TaxID=2024227 RepID=UPI000B96C7EB|nr:hypothetical protein [Prevotella sp. P4-67]OYP71120.1 hypothetical protein CIK92_08310 [Prevotella sp. P4-67]